MTPTDYQDLIDLSLPLDSQTPVYPGDPPVEVAPIASMPDDYVNVLGLRMATHQGTHLDAPYHQIADGRTLDDYRLETFFNHAIKIDLVPTEPGDRCERREGILYRQVITAEDLAPHEEALREAEAVLLHTGYGAVLLKGRVDKAFPVLDVSAAELLARCENLHLIGIDSLTVDRFMENTIHLILLGHGKTLLLETLVRLDQLPSTFTLCCFPLAIRDADGAPCRAVALCE